ncbi:Programmed cell death protein 6, partial [Haplosporangium gracile]
MQHQRQQYQHHQQVVQQQYQYQQQQPNQYQPQQQHQRNSMGNVPANNGNSYCSNTYRSSSSTLPALTSLRDWFDAVDTDYSGGLSCEELQRALMNGDGWTPFNVETVRMMMNMFDRDGDGSISFNEFIGLWNYIEKWKACFQNYDLDGSGTIDAHELKQALRGFGYNLSDST